MLKLKRQYAVFVAILMILSMILTGCGGNKAEEQKAATSTSESTVASAATTSAEPSVAWDKNKKDKVVISVINNYYTAGQKQLAEDYTRLHPETEVIIDVIASNDAYTANFKTKMATDKNTAPDIIHGNITGEGYPSLMAKNWVLDVGYLLDETNPYNDNKLIKEQFNQADVTEVISSCGGKLGYLPFDRVGVGVFYNKTIFDKNGLKAPETYEEWIDACKKLQEAGIKTPIAASFVADWVQGMIADIAYRTQEDKFLVQPGDGIYDAATMKANEGFKFDTNNLNCDEYTVFSDERKKAFLKEKSLSNPLNSAIWTEFAKIGQYFQKNWTAPDDTKIIADFESQNVPMLLHGSWNVGKLVDDVNKLPKDKQFEWGVFKIPSFASIPAGLDSKDIRSLYVFGNQMAVVSKDDKDHMARVIDVYKYYFSPKVAQMLYDVTLKNGNFVQGPPCILGVELSEENANRLDGFRTDAKFKFDFGEISGKSCRTQADQGVYEGLLNKLTDGKISVDEFLKQLDPIAKRYVADQARLAGYDLDPKTKDAAPK